MSIKATKQSNLAHKTTHGTGSSRSNNPPKLYRVTAMVPMQVDIEARTMEEAEKIAKSMNAGDEVIEYPVGGRATKQAQPFPLSIEKLGVDK